MNKELRYLIDCDIYRHYGSTHKPFLYGWRNPELGYLVLFRKTHFHYKKGHKTRSLFYRFKLKRLQRKFQIQIPYDCEIGPGFYIGHYGRVIVNGSSVIGKNVNISTGVTIGWQPRGKYRGTPTISDNVWIGTNAVIIGNIKIGEDVLIAPNAYVNRDVPPHSIVIGNPAQIIARENATEDYINNVPNF